MNDLQANTHQESGARPSDDCPICQPFQCCAEARSMRCLSTTAVGALWTPNHFGGSKSETIVLQTIRMTLEMDTPERKEGRRFMVPIFSGFVFDLYVGSRTYIAGGYWTCRYNVMSSSSTLSSKAMVLSGLNAIMSCCLVNHGLEV